jgi:hypothetical protein
VCSSLCCLLHWNRDLYERIEDRVRDIATRIGCSVVEIDKAIFSARTTGFFYGSNNNIELKPPPKKKNFKRSISKSSSKKT